MLVGFVFFQASDGIRDDLDGSLNGQTQNRVSRKGGKIAADDRGVDDGDVVENILQPWTCGALRHHSTLTALFSISRLSAGCRPVRVETSTSAPRTSRRRNSNSVSSMKPKRFAGS